MLPLKAQREISPSLPLPVADTPGFLWPETACLQPLPIFTYPSLLCICVLSSGIETLVTAFRTHVVQYDLISILNQLISTKSCFQIRSYSEVPDVLYKSGTLRLFLPPFPGLTVSHFGFFLYLHNFLCCHIFLSPQL